MPSYRFTPILPLALVLLSSQAAGQGLRDCTLSDSLAEDSVIEHVFGGVPDDSTIHPRRAYVLSYDDEHFVPKWAAWYATKEYRDTPRRKSRWKAFRRDPEIPTVEDDDYVGWFDSEDNFARGHIVPYFIAGGDRDDDGIDAEFEDSLRVEDIDDACTVFEINAMSNIAPQYHNRFNGQPGLWWLLETDVRGLVDAGRNLHIFAGSIFVDGVDVQRIGDRDASERSWKIGVPHGFFKVVIDVGREEAVGFMFSHAAPVQGACDIDDADTLWPSACVVTIDAIEDATGLEFFSALTQDENQRLRAASTKATWVRWVNAP